MADYNAHRPDIVGFEWVPIKDAAYQPDPTIERGYVFTVAASGGPIVPRRGLYMVDAVPVGTTITQVPIVSVYSADSLTFGQNIFTQRMECSFASEVGDGTFVNGTGADCLTNSSDNKYYQFGSAVPDTGTLTTRFSVAGINGTVLNASIIYAASGDLTRLGTAPNGMFIGTAKTGAGSILYGTGVLEGGTTVEGDTTVQYGRISLGNVDPQGPYTAGGAGTTNDRIPWNSGNLGLFNNPSVPQYDFFINWTNLTAGICRLHYLALEVTTSVVTTPFLVGGVSIGSDNNATDIPYEVDENYVNLFSHAYPGVTGLALVPGDYAVTLRLGDLGDMRSDLGNTPALVSPNTRPTINALRELYQEPAIRGIEITRPRTSSELPIITGSHVIPAVAVTTTGAPTLAYAGCHGYDDQYLAINFSIFGSIQQSFQSRNRYGSLEYPWFRFYARRRSGAECIGLRVNGPGGSFAIISGEDLDALPEIVDGWREVTLRFEAPSPIPVMDASSTTLSFDIDYEPFTNGSLLQEVGMEVLGAASVTELEPAEYQPGVSSPRDDISFLFSTDPPAITGIGVVPKSFPVTGIGIECTTPSGCIPTGVPYNHVTWTIPNFQTEIFDSFDRTLSASWGNANTGQLWTNTGGAASDYSVTGSDGVHTMTSVNVPRHSTIGPTTLRDFDVTTVVRMPQGVEVTGAPWSSSVLGRFTDVSNYYRFQAEITTDETIFNVSIIRRSGGVDTTLATGRIDMYPTSGFNFNIINDIAIRVSAQGPVLSMKMWNANDQAEPITWQLIVTDSTFTAGQVGVRTILNTGNTNTLPLLFRYHMFWCSPLLDNFGYYELQRRDEDTDWQTILAATSPGVTGFCDSEARIGVTSEYRMREVNHHRFTGPWSVTVTGVAPNPASSLAGDAAGHELLVFSSNEDQSGAQVLAYEQVWEGNPTNEMTYFEGSGMVQFQRMYGRDYQVGFHALERGGVQFTRTLLVQNAAVSPPVLEDAFMTLRDLAWEGVPYVCVRTSNGDRWFTAVEVPTGSISRRRRLQLVQVRVTEVSDTSFEADPPLWFADTLRSELPCRAQQAAF